MLTLTVILTVASIFLPVPELSNTQWAVLFGACLLVALFPSFFLGLALIAGALYFSQSR